MTCVTSRIINETRKHGHAVLAWPQGAMLVQIDAEDAEMPGRIRFRRAGASEWSPWVVSENVDEFCYSIEPPPYHLFREMPKKVRRYVLGHPVAPSTIIRLWQQPAPMPPPKGRLKRSGLSARAYRALTPAHMRARWLRLPLERRVGILEADEARRGPNQPVTDGAARLPAP